MTPAAVLFDFDGVLADSRAAITSCLNHTLATLGAPTRPAGELERWIGPPLPDVMAELVGPERADEAVLAYRERYATASLELTEVMPGMAEALARVAAAVPVAIATSKPAIYAAPLCARLGLAEHLAAIEGPALDTTAEPKAVTVARALAALGLAPGVDVPLVGDRLHDVVAARANRIRAVGVLWGIGDRAELEAAGADTLVASPAELPAAVGIART